jgi:fibronectin type 3 domain-containing protein
VNSLAGQANLAWDPPDISTDVTGYMIHYGTASGAYSQAVDVGNTTSYTVSNLSDGQTYYFAVTAQNAAHYESVYSNEVSIMTSPPQYLLVTLKPGTGQGTVSLPDQPLKVGREGDAAEPGYAQSQ